MPQLSVRRGRAAVDFYKAAFGAAEEYRVGGTAADEAVVAQLSIDGASFWVADESPPHQNFSPESLGGAGTRMLLVVADPLSAVARAVSAGAIEIAPVREEHGWLLGRIEDPYGHHWEIGTPLGAWPPGAAAHAAWQPPRVPASAGALVYDRSGRLLVVNPTYKKHWTIPGGQIEAGGETPWGAVRREALEECGLRLELGRLVCVDFLAPKDGRERGIRFLFDCGTVSDDELAAIRLQREELSEYRLVDLAEAQTLLSGPVRRRVMAAVGAEQCLYLEDGRPVAGVPPIP